MAVSSWTANTAFSVGNIRHATVQQATGLYFQCTSAGTSAGTEPSWPTDVGSTIVDGGVTWTAISSVYEELLKLAPSAVIELFELRLDNSLHGSSDVYRFHNGMSRNNVNISANVVFNSQEYVRLPIAADGFEYSNTGTLPRPTLTVSNLDGTMTILLALVNATTAGNDLGGAEVRRIRTLKKYLDDINFRFDDTGITQDGNTLITQDGNTFNFSRLGNPSGVADPHAEFPQERWFIDRKANESRNSVTFELASKFDLAGQKLPKRQIIANVCQWIYKSTECGYNPAVGPGKQIDGVTYTRFDVNNEGVTTDAEDVCGKRVASCKCRFGDNAELPFGSFPGAGLTK